MSRSHARFEALAGAILLGEATTAERRQYMTHARGCPQCAAEDLGEVRTLVLTAVAVSRELETWRPQLRGAVAGVIEHRRARASWVTANALAGAIAISLALNAALASGLAQRTAEALRPAIARLVTFEPMVAARSPAHTENVR